MTETSANVTLEEVHPSCLLSAAENERLEEDEDHDVDLRVLLFAYLVVDLVDSSLLVEICHASNLLHPSLVTSGAVMENAPCCFQNLEPCSQVVSYQEEDLDAQVHLVLDCTSGVAGVAREDFESAAYQACS